MDTEKMLVARGFRPFLSVGTGRGEVSDSFRSGTDIALSSILSSQPGAIPFH